MKPKLRGGGGSENPKATTPQETDLTEYRTVVCLRQPADLQGPFLPGYFWHPEWWSSTMSTTTRSSVQMGLSFRV